MPTIQNGPMLKNFSYFAIVLLALVSVSEVKADSTKTVLAILPLSGPIAKWGVAVKNGLELGLENSGVKLKLEDHKNKPADAAAAFESAFNEGRPDVIVVFGSPTSLAVAQKSQDRGIPMIAIATSDKIEEGKPLVFRHMTPSSTMARLIVSEIRRRSISKVTTITTIHDGMLAFQKAFEKEFNAEILSKEEVAPDESDFRTVALNIVRRKPEAVFITLMPPQASLFAHAVRGLGYKGELFAANQLDDESERKAAGKAFEGLVFVRDGERNREEFSKLYAEKFKIKQDNFAGNGYDVGLLIKKGLESGDLVKSIGSTKDFKGALGVYSIFPNRSFDVPGALWTVHDSTPQPLY